MLLFSGQIYPSYNITVICFGFFVSLVNTFVKLCRYFITNKFISSINSREMCCREAVAKIKSYWCFTNIQWFWFVALIWMIGSKGWMFSKRNKQRKGISLIKIVSPVKKQTKSKRSFICETKLHNPFTVRTNERKERRIFTARSVPPTKLSFYTFYTFATH